jgi:DNA primase catalytic subunit
LWLHAAVASKKHFGQNPRFLVEIAMSNYFVPEGMRSATLEERKEFYTSEFNLEKVSSWLQAHKGKTKFAVIIGRHTKIFLPEYRGDADTTITIDEYADLEDLRRQILEFLPEAVYYDRNVYFENDHPEGQELAFDVDPENIMCPIHGTLADKMKRHQGLSFCATELELAKQQTMGLYEFLERQFSDLRVVYSGRGFHVHVFDEEAYGLSPKERSEIAATVKAKGFAIDVWVTEGEMRLIRLPYSLHGMVSRIAVPLEKKEIEKFNPILDEKCIPKYLKKGRAATSFS